MTDTVADSVLEKSRPAFAEDASGATNRRLARLSLAALGVVFGDIGTSPLYAIRECFHGEYGIAVSQANVLGVLSLVFWALMLIVTIKYLTFILRADNHGDGGVIALTAQLKSGRPTFGRTRWVLISLGLFAACLLYGDGMITPAISVLSAVEGLRLVTPVFNPYVIPLTIVILASLFLIQRHGTARVGGLFGPVILLWFVVLGVLGITQIVRTPHVLAALMPWHAVGFLTANGVHGFLVLGAVFLVVTGAEAIYADMGHFGKSPIRLAWLAVVFPALVLNYFGQGALLLTNPEITGSPFYALVPAWAMIPMVILATAATIIASQAVITGAFSLTRQAMRLGYLPRMRITHTSAGHIGQIYVAPVNWILMLCTITLVIGFRSSSSLAAAYGVAVTSTMLITTTLFYTVAVKRWKWSIFYTAALCACFFVVDFAFFGANISKIFHGAWFPLAIGGIVFTLMLTWKRGRQILANQLGGLTPPLRQFLDRIQKDPPQQIRGQVVYLVSDPERAPAAMLHNLNHNKMRHSEIAFLHFKPEESPRVPNFKKVDIEKLGRGIYRITAHYGFMEQPEIADIMSLAREKGLPFDMDEVSFFLGRERLSVGKQPKMRRWRIALFRFMSRNAQDAASFFDIPAGQVIEVGVQLDL